ncbi:MAG TPA: BON domain-containing protein [Candidatus Melainabacteria bacterium]|nr:BON domain-containing protein [Candidatus Melainabacteria bacterium]
MMRNIAILGCLLLSLNAVAVNAKDAPQADNSAQNAGAERRDAVTAEKQNNKKSNVQVLAQIRKSIVDDNGLSMNAKNAKILFKDGLVTLKGPVDSDSEKARVEELAKSCSSVSSVKNMLTVAPKK